MKVETQVLPKIAQGSGDSEGLMEGLLLRIQAESELNSSKNWLPCPRCGEQMWITSALCDECDLD
jgi:hypothetical protein